MGKRRLRVDMDGLLDALEVHEQGVTPYFHRQRGIVAFHVEGYEPDGDGVDPDDPDWVWIDRIESRDAFRVMERFVSSLDEPDVQRRLRRALEGRGAFRRFRETLHGCPDLRARFEQVQRENLIQHALAFLDRLDIEPEYELRRPDPAPPPAPSSPPAIQLHHVLLLGAPDGETGIVDGRVLRVVRAASPKQARKLFERLVREVLELQGLEWRRNFVEDRDEVDCDPFMLSVEEDLVSVEVAVPREIREMFTR